MSARARRASGVPATARAAFAPDVPALRRLHARALGCPATAGSPVALAARWRVRASLFRVAAFAGGPGAAGLRRAAWTLDVAAARASNAASRSALLRLLARASAPFVCESLVRGAGGGGGRDAAARDPAVALAHRVVASELTIWLIAHPAPAPSPTLSLAVPRQQSRHD